MIIMRVPLLVRLAFFFYVFTIPLEAVDVGEISSSLSLSKIAGVLFCLASLLNWRRVVCLPPQVMIWFAVYMVITLFHGLFIQEDNLRSFLSRIFTFFQLGLLSWLSWSVLRTSTILTNTLLAFICGAGVLVAGLVFNVEAFSAKTLNDGSGIDRVSVLGEDANKVSTIFVIAALSSIGLVIQMENKIRKTTIVYFGLSALFVAGIVSTGSRTGVVAFIGGNIIYFVVFARRVGKLKNVLVVAGAGIALLLYMVFTNPATIERWNQAIVEGDSSGRDGILSAAKDMIYEKPIFGWHPIEGTLELGRRVRGGAVGMGARDPHNLYVYLLIEGGIVGAFPFFMGLWLTGLSAWKNRGKIGAIPLGLFVSLMITNLFVNWIGFKITWLILAIALSRNIPIPGPLLMKPGKKTKSIPSEVGA